MRRLGADPVMQAQLVEALSQLQQARNRVQKESASRTLRNLLIVLTGAGVAVAAVPKLRTTALAGVSRAKKLGLGAAMPRDRPASIEEVIEVNVPVSAAYNQWTQFEEFPTFMEGVEEVTQLDDTLLHWAVTVAGKRAEWDAKITEQKPDRRIAWESIDGKQNRGAVTFEPAGSESRTRVRFKMSYITQGTAEAVGSSVGLDRRRVSGDLERFRELMESKQHESGAWRGEIKDGQKKNGGKSAS